MCKHLRCNISRHWQQKAFMNSVKTALPPASWHMSNESDQTWYEGGLGGDRHVPINFYRICEALSYLA
jgi:hypothetical protein